MTTSPTHICVAQDAYTDQFHEVSMEVYRDIYDGHSIHHHPHCGVIDVSRNAAVLFVDEEISSTDFENFSLFCTHKLKRKPTRIVRLRKPSKKSVNNMIENMISNFMQEIANDLARYNEEIKRKQQDDSIPPSDGYGELGFDDFRDATGNDTWGGL